MSRRRSSFERAYADGILGSIQYQMHTSITSQYARPVSNAAIEKVVNVCNDCVEHSLNLRKQQALVDILIRSCPTNKKICAPHVLEHYDTIVPPTSAFLHRQPKQKTVVCKTRMSLAETLFYTLSRCPASEYHGALFPYQVEIPDDDANHANMVYLYFNKSHPLIRVHCYLIEPNGEAFTKKYPSGYNNLTRAWHYLCSHAREALDVKLIRRVQVVGENVDRESGLQTCLGSYRTRSLRIGARLHNEVRRSGYGICGAVVFWLFRMWLRSSKDCTLDDYYKILLRYTKEHRVECQHKIMKFIYNINRKVRETYAVRTQDYIDNDLDVIRKHVEHKFGSTLRAHKCSVNLCYRLQLGNGTTSLLAMNRRVCVGAC